MAEDQQVSNYGKRPVWHWILLYAAIAVVAYGLFYYFLLAKNSGTSNDQVGNYQQSASPTVAVQTQAPTLTVAPQKITIEGSEYAFTPSKITLKKGQLAEITFKNTGKYPHNLAIADLSVKSNTIMSGQQDVVSFTPDKTGQFSFSCTVPGHADKGMTGTLTVE